MANVVLNIIQDFKGQVINIISSAPVSFNPNKGGKGGKDDQQSGKNPGGPPGSSKSVLGKGSTVPPPQPVYDHLYR